MNAEHNSLAKLAVPSVPPPTQGVDPITTQSAGEDDIVVDSVWVAASLKADGYEVIVDGGQSLPSSCDTGQESCAADGSLSSLLGSSSETCLAGGPRTSPCTMSEAVLPDWASASTSASSETCLAGEPRESTPASSEPCHAGGSRTSSGTTCTDNSE
ncbi:hypothetical protein HPB50_026402 [Hyalomma asiaticum]|uniref:Uncharacterized protein n=1 Tax=Hyalomma asiaticum TaxID=266040 RepID=A0ACB7T2M7_HYAAI|nr:hypothetical protein HPB50_026402 [Hyalomma asiaticum]